MDPPERGQSMSVGCCWTSKVEVFELLHIPESISLGKGSSERGNDLSLCTCYALLDAHGWRDLWDTIWLHHCCLHWFKAVLLRCVHPPLPWRRALEVSALWEALWETFNLDFSCYGSAQISFRCLMGLHTVTEPRNIGLLPILCAWLIITCTMVTFGGFFTKQ